jgi:predicted membrane channel-forming protein YqfA (hemolysin III family)
MNCRINHNTMETKKGLQRISILIASVFITVACIQGYRNIGWPVVVIVGGSGVIGFVMWYRTYLKYPVDPR